MRSPQLRYMAVVAASAVTAVALTSSLVGAPAAASARRARRIERIPPEVVSAALASDGEVVRRTARARVEKVTVPSRLQAAHGGVPSTLWRVTVTGRYPPRAQRYVVLAGHRRVGYGVPSPSGGTVSTITTDPGVLDEPITTRYGDGATATVAAPATPALDPPSAEVPDPGRAGPYDVARAVYDFGDRAFQPSELDGKVELTASVHYPERLARAPFPLVLFMHGNHTSCYRDDTARYDWPCPKGWDPLPNYVGYQYIAKRLASHGYVVVSVSANGVNVLGNEVRDAGMRQRGELLDAHIDLWRTWSTTGGEPFGETFVGKVDLSRIGTMGHSRGGEGVVWHNIVDQEQADPYGVDAVLAIAPVRFTRATINEVPFAVVLPYCDGDVSDLQGVRFFDRSRYKVPGDPAPKHAVTAFAANHNYFNTVWTPGGKFPGGIDDGDWVECGERLSPKQQRRMGRAYVSGFFRRYLGSDTTFDAMWTGAASPSGIDPARTLVSYLAPDAPDRRLDVARFTDSDDLSIGDTGGEVSARRLSRYAWCANTRRNPCVPGRLGWLDIHRPGLSEAIVGWSRLRGRLRFEIPVDYADVRNFDAFQFRAAVNPGYGANDGIERQDLVVRLIDERGERAEVAASEVGNEALSHPVSGRRWAPDHVIMNQVRFPLRAFKGVDLRRISAVVLRFSRTRTGVINLADLAFSAGER